MRLRRRRHPAEEIVTSTALPTPGDEAAATPEDRGIIERSIPYTMTGAARLQSLIDAVRYCVSREISGSFAECGVWRGGSVLAMILTLQDLDRADRDLYLYDTFEGMTEPTEHDTSRYHPPAKELWEETDGRPWPALFAPETFNEEAVRDLVRSTGYPQKLVHFVRGRVEETIPDEAPDRLSLLRLDTDWYESTRHELVHLYPRLEKGGVLIIDDYGHWEGARRAVDEYFAHNPPPLLLSRVDYAGRMAIKH
jgi:hypothetical protein